MLENLETIKPACDELKEKNNNRQSSGNSTSYRGFTSIDQEMEREIAMQWFQKINKAQSFRGTLLYKGKLS